MNSRTKAWLKTALFATAMLLIGAALASGGSADLTLRSDPELGSVLVDASGNSLYIFKSDAEGISTCDGVCADNWPPLIVRGEVVVGDGVDGELIGTLTRSDGALQVTYAGWPLYTFSGDIEAGDTAGQGADDLWFLVAPDGAAISTAVAQGDDLFDAYLAEGAAVFASICAACHGAQGDEELSTHVAFLAANKRLDNSRLVVRRVIHGGTYMPAFGAALSDREVAAVATFVRNSFGNDYGFVGEEDAAANR